MSHFGNVTKFDTVLAAASAMTVDGTFFGDPASSIYNAADKPPNTTDVQYLVMIDGTYGRRVVLAIGYAVTDEWRYFGTRDILNGEWLNDWRKVSVSTPPQEYSLPLAEGWGENQPCRYYKEQDNEVSVTVAARRDSETPVSQTMLVGVLPAGYRPKYVVVVPCVVDAMGAVTGHISVDTGGGIYVQSNSEYVDFATAQIKFLAGS